MVATNLQRKMEFITLYIVLTMNTANGRQCEFPQSFPSKEITKKAEQKLNELRKEFVQPKLIAWDTE